MEKILDILYKKEEKPIIFYYNKTTRVAGKAYVVKELVINKTKIIEVYDSKLRGHLYLPPDEIFGFKNNRDIYRENIETKELLQN